MTCSRPHGATWTVPRTLRAKARQKLFDSLRLPYGRLSTHTHTHTHNIHRFSVLLSRSLKMMRVAVPAGMACADYRESTVLSWSHIFLLMVRWYWISLSRCRPGASHVFYKKFIDLSTCQDDFEKDPLRFETGPTSVDQINSPICHGSNLTMTTKQFPQVSSKGK